MRMAALTWGIMVESTYVYPGGHGVPRSGSGGVQGKQARKRERQTATGR